MGLRRTAGVTGRPWPGQAARREGPLRPPPHPWEPHAPGQVAPGLTNPVWTGAGEQASPPQQAPDSGDNGATRQKSAAPSGREQESVWEPVNGGDRSSAWARTRRVAAIGALGTVVAVGALDIVRTGVDLVSGPPPAVAPAVSDQQFAGFASTAAVDYLSWDASAKAQRQAALARYAAPGTSIDGWDGKGRLWADSPSVLDVRRDGGRAVATVRVRVIPAAEKPTTALGQPDTRGDAGQLAAAAPAPATDAAGTARWITVALPLAEHNGRPVITARPALIGSAPEAVPSTAVTASSTGDAALAKKTEPAITRLLTAYASGDLAYARLSGTSFEGLAGAARLAEVSRWTVIAPDEQTGEQSILHGRAEVTWQLTGGAGGVTSDYAIDLSNQDGRWYLAAISADVPAVRNP